MNSQSIDLDSPIEPRPPGYPVPLTAAQARIWNHALGADGRRLSSRIAIALRIVGRLDVTLLQRSIEIVIRRHEALRTRIVLKGGSPYQQIESAPVQVLSIIDLSDQPYVRSDVSSWAQKFVVTPIDLAVGPLFESKVWRLSDEEHVLILLIDHIVSDGVSNGIITREMWECYREGMHGRLETISLPRIPVQFPDYAVWQAQTHLAWMEKHAEYWRQHLRGASSTVIPADQSLSNGKPAVGITKHILFGEKLTVALRGAARHQRSLLSVFILTVYAVVLSAWCRTEDLLVAFASHGRHRPTLHNVVGYIANHLLLRIHVKREQAFGELLAQVKREIANALEHRDFDRLPDLLPEYSTEAVFNWQTSHSEQGPPNHDIIFECSDQVSHSSKVGLDAGIQESYTTNQLRILPFPLRALGAPKFFVMIFETPLAIDVTVTFDSRVLAPVTIERFGRNLVTVAKEICQHSMSSISSLLGKIDMI